MSHPALREGSRGPEVERLTAILKKRGYALSFAIVDG